MGLDVTIVEMLPHVLLATMEPEFIDDVEKTLSGRGVQLRTGAKVVEFQQSGGKVSGVRLDQGDTIEADFFVMSIGVVPNTELAAEAGIETSRFGIVVDDHLRTNAANVYAAGDCVAKRSFVTGEPTRGELGTNAVFMARVVGQNILGRDKVFTGVINASASTAFELSFGSAGLTEGAARESGLDVVAGYSEIMDRYPMMDEVGLIRTKLVFELGNGRLVGGSVLRRGRGAAQNVDFLSLAIQKGTTLDDLLDFQYATHPELAAKPSDNTYVFAAKEARDR